MPRVSRQMRFLERFFAKVKADAEFCCNEHDGPSDNGFDG